MAKTNFYDENRPQLSFDGKSAVAGMKPLGNKELFRATQDGRLSVEARMQQRLDSGILWLQQFGDAFNDPRNDNQPEPQAA